MQRITCEIVTPAERLYTGEVEFVALPGELGEIGVLAGHEPVVTTLSDGLCRLSEEGINTASGDHFLVMGGYAQISEDKVIILADHARKTTEIDVSATQASLESLKERAASAQPHEQSYYQSQIRWCELQLEAANK